MARTPRTTTRRLPDTVRRRLEIATAMAWESLVETHVEQATRFVHLLGERLPLEETLTRYLLEMDMGDSMASAVRTRVLVTQESEDTLAEAADDPSTTKALEEEEGWRRFRPDVMMRGVLERQRRNDETEHWIQLALARAEEKLITTHVDNAITFAALLEEHLPVDRGVQQYLDAVALTGSRAQAVVQRTMARLADVHLPR
jgi:hypothetical protein